MLRYYVYVLKLVDGSVFYVGKGSRQRMDWHRKVLSRPQTKEYRRGVYIRMREFLAGREFAEEKVFETDDETAALLHEAALIRHYGFDNLVNTQTHAFTGRKLKADARALMSKARREYIAKLQAETGHKMPPEVAAKISAAGKGHAVTPETTAKIQAALRANPANAEQARQQALAMCRAHTGKKRSPEYCAKLSALRKGMTMSTEAVAARVASRLSHDVRSTAYKSCYRGVSWFAPKKAWQSRICGDGKVKLLGQFKLELDAAWAYDNAFELAHGRRPNGTDKAHVVTRFQQGKHGLLIPVVKAE